jgi:hypothetical protein
MDQGRGPEQNESDLSDPRVTKATLGLIADSGCCNTLYCASIYLSARHLLSQENHAGKDGGYRMDQGRGPEQNESELEMAGDPRVTKATLGLIADSGCCNTLYCASIYLSARHWRTCHEVTCSFESGKSCRKRRRVQNGSGERARTE